MNCLFWLLFILKCIEPRHGVVPTLLSKNFKNRRAPYDARGGGATTQLKIVRIIIDVGCSKDYSRANTGGHKSKNKNTVPTTTPTDVETTNIDESRPPPTLPNRTTESSAREGGLYLDLLLVFGFLFAHFHSRSIDGDRLRM